jgi:hypothetical protein
VGSYYYLVAQLPYLTYGQTPPMPPQAFKEMVKPMLTSEDSAFLDMVSLDPQYYTDRAPVCGSDFIDGWREWERTLRLNLARNRAVKAKREGSLTAEPPALPVDAVTVATRAVAEESPLEAEITLDKARWSAIDSLLGYEYFDRNTVFAYLLKLLILQRRASFQTETGFSEYKSLYAAILEAAQSGTSRAGESK